MLGRRPLGETAPGGVEIPRREWAVATSASRAIRLSFASVRRCDARSCTSMDSSRLAGSHGRRSDRAIASRWATRETSEPLQLCGCSLSLICYCFSSCSRDLYR